MIYENIKKAIFIDRPNRFIAHVQIDGNVEVCHVKNTGRCRELLIPGAVVYVQECDSPTRKTKYDLISVYKGDRLINIDSQVPNKVFSEWLVDSDFFEEITLLRPEKRYGDSRFDFYIEADDRRAYVEVKGVTLEEDGVARFPDAPTERGIKHLLQLIQCVKDGYDAYVCFIIQMKDITYMEPNWAMHPAFGEALQKAKDAGVHIFALDCEVTKTSITASDFVDVKV